VLKIATVHDKPKALRVHLCGDFTGEYVPEIERVLSTQGNDLAGVALDLENVSFVDREAMVFLCGAKSRCVSIENIPSYVTRWIEQEGRCGSQREFPPSLGQRSSDSKTPEK